MAWVNLKNSCCQIHDYRAMMTPTDYLYLMVIGLVRSVKWVELQLLTLVSEQVTAYNVHILGKLGIVVHSSDASYQNWKLSDEEEALHKCRRRYSSLVHIKVKDPTRKFLHMTNTGTWGFGEGYVDGLWDYLMDEGDVAEYASRLLKHNIPQDGYFNWWNKFWHWLEFGLFNMQTRSRSWLVAQKHYDLGNDLYEAMLDPHMQYTCGYWANANNLNEAQLHKLELIAQKLRLKPGMTVLDIGCGWGMLCKYLAERHQVRCVGVTISKEGAEYGRRQCEGLPVKILLQDYRDLTGANKFDRVVAIGILEHIGIKNYSEFFSVAHRALKDDGIFLCHSIAVNHANSFKSERWLCTHIFPGGSLPNARDIANFTEGKFVIEDWHNFGLDYAKTLVAWRENFKRAWPTLKKSSRYDERFYRMWILYLTLCEGGFLSRKFQLWQVVLSKDGLKEGYISVR